MTAPSKEMNFKVKSCNRNILHTLWKLWSDRKYVCYEGLYCALSISNLKNLQLLEFHSGAIFSNLDLNLENAPET